MYFQSWADFWAMGNYGFYVWLSFGTTYAMLAALVIYSRWQHKQLKRDIAAQAAREQRIKQYQEQQN
jgi:heme exporter protein D